MSSSLLNELPNPSFDIYHSDGFMSMIEYHLPSLRIDQSTSEHAVDIQKRYVYEGDFYGYLKYINLPAHLHWITLRLNNYDSNTQFKDVDVILLPSLEKIENLMSKYRTKNRDN